MRRMEDVILFINGWEGNNREDSLEKVIQEFERIFERFEEKPCLFIDFNSWYFEKFYGQKSEVDELSY